MSTSEIVKSLNETMDKVLKTQDLILKILERDDKEIKKLKKDIIFLLEKTDQLADVGLEITKVIKNLTDKVYEGDRN